jgi:hypothetical protein
MTVCLPWWTATDATHNCMSDCRSLLAVTASWFYLYLWILFMCIRRWKSHVWWFLGMKELLNLLPRCWIGRAGPISWTGRSCQFTILDSVLWGQVTKHIFIPPFGIYLIEGLSEIERVLRLAQFWDSRQHRVVILFRSFGITNQSHF